MIGILGLIFPFFALIALGVACVRLLPQPAGSLNWLNVFVIYVALPALYVRLVALTPVEELANPAFIAATTLSTFLVFMAIFAVGFAKSRRNVASATIDGLAAAYGNIGYMGPALALAAFGPEVAVPVALILCFDNTLHFTMAPLMMTIGGKQGVSAGRLGLEIARRVLLHPIILAILLGLVLAASPVKLPGPADRVLELLAGAAAPCALFAMGVTLGARATRAFPVELAYLVPAKLVLHPLVVWLVLGLAGDFEPAWVQTAILMASLPTATSVFVIAQQYGVWQERASAAVVATTAAAVVTMTFVLTMLTSGAVPLDPFPN